MVCACHIAFERVSYVEDFVGFKSGMGEGEFEKAGVRFGVTAIGGEGYEVEDVGEAQPVGVGITVGDDAEFEAGLQPGQGGGNLRERHNVCVTCFNVELKQLGCELVIGMTNGFEGPDESGVANLLESDDIAAKLAGDGIPDCDHFGDRQSGCFGS